MEHGMEHGAQFLLELGKTHVEKGQLQAAQEAFQRCINLYAPGPVRDESLYQLALLFKLQQNHLGYAEVVAALIKAGWLGRPRVQLCRELAEVYVLMGKLAEAIEVLEVALTHTPERSVMKAILYEEMVIYSTLVTTGAADQKAARYSNLLQLSFGFARNPLGPIRTEPTFLLGHHFRRDNKILCALVCYNLALDNEPRNSLLWFTIGSVFEMLKNHGEATACYEQALRLSPDSPEPWNALGNIAAKSDQRELALSYFEKSYSIQPSESIAKKIEILTDLQPASTEQAPGETRPAKKPRVDQAPVKDEPPLQPLSENRQSAVGAGQKNSPTLAPAASTGRRMGAQGDNNENENAAVPHLQSNSFEDGEEHPPAGDEAHATTLLPHSKPSPKRAAVAPPLPVPVVHIVEDLRGVPVEGLLRKEEAFCYDKPVTLIKGLMEALGFDMRLFSSAHLSQQFGNLEVDIRTQQQQEADANFCGNHELWRCTSSFKKWTVAEYARYQETFAPARVQEAGEREHPAKRIKVDFCTNLDLTDSTKWSRQYAELQKLPVFLQVDSPEDMLYFYDEEILGMNRAQMYMKVPGCRTPGHQENNNFCSVNINLGPGNCEWFAVEPQYWRQIDALCRKNKVDFLKGSWWPALKDLTKAKIPYIRFTQEKGDVVHLNSGTVHWVQALGVCNNVAWNVGPLTSHQFDQAIERYSANIKEQYKSIVPMETLAWKLTHSKASDPKFAPMLLEFLKRSLSDQKDQAARIKELQLRVLDHKHQGPAFYCLTCQREVFAHLYVQDKDTKEQPTLCEGCASKLIKAGKPMVVFRCHQLQELEGILKDFEERLASSTN